MILYVLVGLILGILAGGYLGTRFAKKTGAESAQLADAQAQKLLAAAQAEADSLKRDAELQGKEVAYKIKAEVEEDIRGRKAEVAKKESAIGTREEQLERRTRDAQRQGDDLGRKEKLLAKETERTEQMAKQAEQALAGATAKLEQIASMTEAEARQVLIDQMKGDAEKAAASEIKRIESTAKEEAAEKAKRIIGTAIQRYASEYVAERTVSVVPLPSDDMKGRLIGREGRNVRALEAATGTDLIIDDTPECITISCFNPVRREIARMAIGKLVADGRIHPTRIEEIVQKCEKDIAAVCKEAGEQAVFDLGLHRVHPDLVTILGQLKFRSSYAQNLLQHSIEVGYLAGIMAGELGLNVKLARRAGLLHDLGKAVDHEQEGAHASVGAALAKKYGEAPRVVQAIAAHHEDVPQESVLDHIVDAANRLSGQRPGARRETLESYVQRLGDLEKMARSYGGVEKAYALQMGREIRVIVENSAMSDEQAVLLSRDLAKRIEAEATYPGQVRICVIRETRASDYAK